MSFRIVLCLTFVTFLTTALVFGDIIPAARTAPWQGNVGVPGGIPTRTTIYKTLSPLGGGQDDQSQITNAINSCPSGQVVQLSAGTFTLASRVYVVKSNFTLRGAGAGVTIFNSTGSQGCFLFGSQQWPPPYWDSANFVSITSGATRGSNTVTVSDTSKFTVDQLMSIVPDFPVWAHNLGGSNDTTRNLRCTFKIRSKTSTTLTFDPPCPFDFSGMNPQALVYDGNNATIKGVGIEDLTIDLLVGRASPGIEFEQAYGCWVKGAEIKNPISRTIRLGVVVSSEIRQCYFHDVQGTGPNHEGVFFDGNCSYNLVEDNIFNNNGVSMFDFSDNTGGNTANVVGYNCFVNGQLGFGDISAHNPHDFLNLIEGNILDSTKLGDGYFGSTSHHTFFRNQIRLLFQAKHLSNYLNVVGNVLGTSGYNLAYDTETAGYNYSLVKPVYELGFPNIGNTDYTGTFGPTTPPNYSGLTNNLSDPDNQKLDYNVKTTILRHGNYDYFNKSVVWDSTISDRNIPNSLYYSAKPSWWPASGVPWPPIGSDLTPLVSKIPAQIRFEALPATRPAAPKNLRKL